MDISSSGSGPPRLGQESTQLAERSGAAVPRALLIRTSIICFLAWVFSVYDYVLFGTLLPQIAKTFGWSTATSTLVATWVTVGTFFVSIAVGPMLDYLGRRISLAITTAGAAITSGLTGFTFSAIYLIVVRAFSGLGYSEEVVNTVYLNEIYGSHTRRGFMYSFVQSGWPVGSLFAAGMTAILFPVVGWRGTFWVATFPVLIIVALTFFLKESPAFENVKRVRRLRAAGHTEEADNLARSSGLQTSEQMGRSGLRMIFARDLRLHTICLSAAWLFNWMAIQVFAVLGTTVLIGAKHVSFASALIVLVLANIAGFCGYIFHGFIGDIIGRRTTIMVGWFIGGCITAVMLFAASGYGLVVTLYALSLFFLNGPYAAMLFYMAESFPVHVRGIGPNTAHIMGPVGAIVGSAVLTALLDSGASMKVSAFVAGSLAMIISALVLLGARKVPGRSAKLGAQQAP
jgi:MFS family permease